MRLQKFLAEAGLASRRASEQIILGGRVAINGSIISELGAKIDPAKDRVTVDGKPVRQKRKLYIALNKPRGCVSTRKDELGRPTVGDWLPKEWSALYPVGRLDYNTEGLLFLTNDGDFSLRLTHPRFGVRKKYRVTIVGRVGADLMAELRRGIFSEGDRLKAEKARIVESPGSETVLELELAEGKNREVRRMFETLGLIVKRLVRIQIGPIKLGQLKPGRWRALTEPEIKSLLTSV